jgi:hypothetical protein
MSIRIKSCSGREMPAQRKGRSGGAGGIGAAVGSAAGSTATTAAVGALGSALGDIAPAGGRTAGGAAGRYIQGAADTFARNPEAMLADLLVRRYGAERGNGLYEMLRPYAEAANVLFLATQGNSATGGTQDQFLNYLDNYWNTMQTPGARIDYEGALRNINNPAAGGNLAQFLTDGRPEDQAGNYLKLMAGAIQGLYHPLIANSMTNRLGIEADRYIGQSGRGQVDPFYQMPGVKRLTPWG